MRVACPNCGAAQEAQIDSTVGATRARCDKCGTSFLVRVKSRPTDKQAEEKLFAWFVRKGDGVMLSFPSDRHLHEGIKRGLVNIEDEVSADGASWTVISALPILAAFLEKWKHSGPAQAAAAAPPAEQAPVQPDEPPRPAPPRIPRSEVPTRLEVPTQPLEPIPPPEPRKAAAPPPPPQPVAARPASPPQPPAARPAPPAPKRAPAPPARPATAMEAPPGLESPAAPELSQSDLARPEIRPAQAAQAAQAPQPAPQGPPVDTAPYNRADVLAPQRDEAEKLLAAEPLPEGKDDKGFSWGSSEWGRKQSSTESSLAAVAVPSSWRTTVLGLVGGGLLALAFAGFIILSNYFNDDEPEEKTATGSAVGVRQPKESSELARPVGAEAAESMADQMGSRPGKEPPDTGLGQEQPARRGGGAQAVAAPAPNPGETPPAAATPPADEAQAPEMQPAAATPPADEAQAPEMQPAAATPPAAEAPSAAGPEAAEPSPEAEAQPQPVAENATTGAAGAQDPGAAAPPADRPESGAAAAGAAAAAPAEGPKGSELLKPVKLELPPANAGKEKGGADETEEAVPATARKGKERGGGAAAEKRAPAARDEEDEPVAEARGFDGLMAKGDRYRKEGECGKALDPYLQAAELKPGYSEIHYKIGECYRHTGQHARAVTYYEKAINLSGYRNAYIGVAKSLSSLGRKADAKDYLKKGLERYEDGMMRMMLQELGN